MKRLLLLLLCLTLLLPVNCVGEAAGLIVTAPEKPVIPGEASVIRFSVPEDGLCSLTVRDAEGNEISVICRDRQAHAGENSIYWNGTYNWADAPAGIWRLCLEWNGESAETPVVIAGGEKPEEAEEPAGLTDDEEILEEIIVTDGTENEAPEPAQDISAEPEQTVYTPSGLVSQQETDPEPNYWTLPMDITDEEAVWKALTAPITVIDTGKSTEKAQIMIRSAPDSDSDGIGVITCMTQGVHVLEKGEDWSLVECYSSSFHDSAVLNWNVLVQGYVPTSYLKEVTPNQELGFVIDKLTQRLYLFREGHLFSTLLVSTGLSNKRQPYNETRSGEFLMTSKVGTFPSDNLRCGMAIRFNRGDLLHEVPYTVLADGGKNYKNCEPKLGTKASHGCIRVQRKKTPEGVNMAWIWQNLGRNSRTRLLIWEDWQGRQIDIPAEDTVLYYNPKGGQFYHRADHCYSVQKKDVTFEPFTYGELDTKPYSKLQPCEYCAPAPRRADIEKVNQVYAPGGDHDPVLTKARESCPKLLR